MEVNAVLQKRLFEGKVVSNKMDKTIVVETEQTYIHPKFHKILRKTKTYKVHDEQNVAQEGDVVEFYEGRKLAKTKYMYLARVITKRAV